MATYYIVNGATDLNATATYNTAEDGSGSAPAAVSDLAADDLVLSQGTQTSWSNPTALAAIDLASFTIGSKFKGLFGASGTSISILCTAGVISIESSGASVFLTSGGTNAEVVVAGGSGGQVRFTGGTWTRGKFSGGANYIDAGIFTNVHQTGGTMEVIKAGTAITLYTHMGGALMSKRNITTLTEDGPAVMAVIDGDAALTTANINGGATLNLRSAATTNVTTANLYRGTITPIYASKPQVITTVNGYGPAGAARLIGTYGTRTIVPGTYNDYGRAGTIVDSKGGGGFAEFGG